MAGTLKPFCPACGKQNMVKAMPQIFRCKNKECVIYTLAVKIAVMEGSD
jgi:rRNA maturation protein Nop10